MAENYDRYLRFETRSTNQGIDKPVLVFKGFTKVELVTGLMIFVCSMYGSLATPWALVGGVFLSIAVSYGLRAIRQRFPKNTLLHLGWYLGFIQRGLPKHLKRPKTTLLQG